MPSRTARVIAISRAPRPWREGALALLGRTSDSEVARKLMRSKSAIQVKREQLGIPPFVISWTEGEIALPGDRERSRIARRLRRSTETIKAKRQ